MNDADFKIVEQQIAQGWQPMPDARMRMTALDLAVKSCGHDPWGKSTMEVAVFYYKFLTGDSDENLHGKGQVER